MGRAGAHVAQSMAVPLPGGAFSFTSTAGGSRRRWSSANQKLRHSNHAEEEEAEVAVEDDKDSASPSSMYSKRTA